ncbi:MAG TPA: hypothetical protein VEA41_22280 [Salinarimonas sp.]|jgi:hypothetical protein|nr:hypothetical protein [Salinarimonas sp.]
MADRDEGRLEQGYKVRQVTNIQASWTQRERGEEGTFTLQLILDNGVEEYILAVDADDLDPMLKLFAKSGYVTFDLERKVLMFANLTVK